MKDTRADDRRKRVARLNRIAAGNAAIEAKMKALEDDGGNTSIFQAAIDQLQRGEDRIVEYGKTATNDRMDVEGGAKFLGKWDNGIRQLHDEQNMLWQVDLRALRDVTDSEVGPDVKRALGVSMVGGSVHFDPAPSARGRGRVLVTKEFEMYGSWMNMLLQAPKPLPGGDFDQDAQTSSYNGGQVLREAMLLPSTIEHFNAVKEVDRARKAVQQVIDVVDAVEADPSLRQRLGLTEANMENARKLGDMLTTKVEQLEHDARVAAEAGGEVRTSMLEQMAMGSNVHVAGGDSRSIAEDTALWVPATPLKFPARSVDERLEPGDVKVVAALVPLKELATQMSKWKSTPASIRHQLLQDQKGAMEERRTDLVVLMQHDDGQMVLHEMSVNVDGAALAADDDDAGARLMLSKAAKPAVADDLFADFGRGRLGRR